MLLDFALLTRAGNLTIPLSGPLIRMPDWGLNGFYYQHLSEQPASA